MPKLKAQPPLPPTIVYLAKHRNQLASKTRLLDPDTMLQAPHPLVLARSEHDLDILRAYRREISQCNERACSCTCNCHAGTTAQCYREELDDETDPPPSRFHYRTPNLAHKRTHRECPTGDHHKW